MVSITDHDTISGLPEASNACREAGLRLVRGVEVSASVSGSEVHLLIYGFEDRDDGLSELLLRQRQSRRQRADEFLENFRKEGFQIDDPSTDAVGEAGGSIGRPHLANLLVRAGAASSRTEAFDKFLSEGAGTFVPKVLPEGKDVISVAAAASGISVLAHPGHYTSNMEVMSLIESGLSGIEVVHPSHDPELVEYYGKLADRYGLLKTGGSDFHGWRENDDLNLGGYYVSADELGNIHDLRTF